MVYIHYRGKFSGRKIFILIMFLAMTTVCTQKYLLMLCPDIILKSDFITTDEFRKMDAPDVSLSEIQEEAANSKITVGELIAFYMCDGGKGDKRDIAYKKDEIKNFKLLYKKKQSENFTKLASACEAVYEDLEVFPVAKCKLGDKDVSYADSWFGERTFGGERRHEGTDIMATVNERGVYPVLSMTEGVIEKIGWLKLGGYRVGIRSPHGGYFYYAHLAAYSREYKVGDKVEAGELIGYMGDSGYGEEGTVGAFDVHLHIGIYINDPEGNEISVNPYNILKSMENCKIELEY